MHLTRPLTNGDPIFDPTRSQILNKFLATVIVLGLVFAAFCLVMASIVAKTPPNPLFPHRTAAVTTQSDSG